MAGGRGRESASRRPPGCVRAPPSRRGIASGGYSRSASMMTIAVAVRRRDAVADRRAPALVGGVANQARARMGGRAARSVPSVEALSTKISASASPRRSTRGVELVDVADLVAHRHDDVDRPPRAAAQAIRWSLRHRARPRRRAAERAIGESRGWQRPISVSRTSHRRSGARSTSTGVAFQPQGKYTDAEELDVDADQRQRPERRVRAAHGRAPDGGRVPRRPRAARPGTAPSRSGSGSRTSAAPPHIDAWRRGAIRATAPTAM